MDTSDLVTGLYASVLVAAICYAGKIATGYFNSFDWAQVAARCIVALPDGIQNQPRVSLGTLQGTGKNQSALQLYFLRLPIAEVLTLATVFVVFIQLLATMSFLLGVFPINDNASLVFTSFVGALSFGTFVARSNAVSFAKRELSMDLSDLL